MQPFAVLSIAGLSGPLDVLRLEGTERMNQLSSWEVDALVAEPLHASELLRQPAVLALSDEVEGSQRAVPLMVFGIHFLKEDRDGLHYSVLLGPEVRLLTLCSGFRVFQRLDVPEIVTQLLGACGIAEQRLDWRLAGSYAKRAYVVQYDEVVWTFIERLLAEEGINYWFDCLEGEPKLVFGDSRGGHGSLDQGLELPFDEGEGLVGARGLRRLDYVEQLGFGRVDLKDYDPRQPDTPIEASAGEGGHCYYEFPACVARGQAKARAHTRLEQLRRLDSHATASGDCIRVQPGRSLHVTGTADEAHDAELLVVAVQHRYARAAPASGVARAYENEALLVPHTGAHRPALPVRPRVAGFEPAFTTGPDGEEIHVDDLANVKLRFPWDRSGVSDDQSSDWVRCLQFGLGGSMALPRVGWEVPVMYRDGNPDEPMVLGRLYNPDAALPYALPAGKTTSGFQSATSPGGGSTNEIRMGDSAGSQELFVHASRDQSVTVGGKSKVKVGVDELHDVTDSLGVVVERSQTRQVQGKQELGIGTSYETLIEGDRSETVGGLEHTKVTANRRCISRGKYGEVVGAVYGVQCNQENIDVKGAYAQSVAGSVAHVAGLGISEDVAGGRSLQVNGAQTLRVSSGYSEDVKGKKSTQAGACSVEAGGDISHQTKRAFTLQTKAGAKLTAGGAVSFLAPKIEISVKGALDAKDLVLRSGTFEARKDTKLEGTIKRTGGSELEK